MKSLTELQRYLSHSHPYQTEFHQAVTEIAEDAFDIYSSEKSYQENNILMRLIEPDRSISFRVTWEDDEGNIHVNRGYRTQFHNDLGPYKGGLRFHPSVNSSIVKFLGFEQTFKNALTGLTLGGAKGGADFNPKGRSAREVMRFCQAFMQELYKHIGPDIDVPAGDIGVGTREISYLFGHYLKLTNLFHGTITGKNHSFGGSCAREEATGYGCIYFLKEALNFHNKDIAGKKILISGAGNVALYAAQKAIAEGAMVLTVSDSGGTLYFEDGMTEEQLESIKTFKFTKKTSLKAWFEEAQPKKAEYCSDKKPWSIQADIALPCATQNEIERSDAKEIVKNQLTAVIEGANMPVTSDAYRVIQKNNIIFIPGKAANAGGVAVSAFERSQNAQHTAWTYDKVEEKLSETMKNIHKNIEQSVENNSGNLPYRQGANRYSFRRLADALTEYGIK